MVVGKEIQGFLEKSKGTCLSLHVSGAEPLQEGKVGTPDVSMSTAATG